MTYEKNQRPIKSNAGTSKVALLALCGCVWWSAGCFTKRPATVAHLGVVTLAHPLIPPAMVSEMLEEAPDIPLEIAPRESRFLPERGGPAKPRVAPTPSSEPAVVEEKIAPILAPQLSVDQEAAAKQATNLSLIVAERNLGATQGKQLSEAQSDLASKVRGFMDSAREAIRNSDWQRATALAKKAEVLSAQLVGE